MATLPLHAEKVAINLKNAKKSYTEKIKITPMDDTVKISAKTITLTPKSEGAEYMISGYFEGQIINKTKNTVLKFNNAYIENNSGEAAIFCEAKAEISSAKDSVNYIVSNGKNKNKTGALQSKKNLVLGGSGTLYVVGNVCHGIKADDTKIKGIGKLYAQGTKNGSALTCDSLAVTKEKSFSAYFINSKNGIKADNTIEIQSGNFYFYDNKTALKTDTAKDNPKAKHSITLSGGTLRFAANEKNHSTEKDAYKVMGAKIIEQ